MLRGHIVTVGVKKQKDGDKFIEAKVRLAFSTSAVSELSDLIETPSDFDISPAQQELPGMKRSGT